MSKFLTIFQDTVSIGLLLWYLSSFCYLYDHVLASFKNDTFTSFRMKLLYDELPTPQKCVLHSPDVFNPEWLCLCYCSTQEDLSHHFHVWTYPNPINSNTSPLTPSVFEEPFEYFRTSLINKLHSKASSNTLPPIILDRIITDLHAFPY